MGIKPMTRAQSKVVLLLASAYNIGGGVAIIFFLGALAPLIGFEPSTNMLFRLFVGGTTITFGIAYFNLTKAETYRAPILFYGTGLKYWAFVAALVSFLFFGLSASVLVLFGVVNLCFALLFTLILVAKARTSR
jgi:hypothetical protein